MRKRFFDRTSLQGAADALLQSGTFSVGSSEPLDDVASARPEGFETWPADYFRIQHVVSTYLPLRYWVWSRASGKRNTQTEQMLAHLIAETEEALWWGACRAGCLTHQKCRLPDLVLGSGNPLQLSALDRATWNREYETALSEVRLMHEPGAPWPRWLAMALHFGSFYLPIGLPPSVNRFGSDAEPVVPQPTLLNELKTFLHADVVRLIGCWLGATGMPRDAAGVPIVDWRVGAVAKLSGRTEEESLLLAE